MPRYDVEIDIQMGSVPHQAKDVDLVIANILSVVLKRIIGDLARATKAGGTLIMSGVLDEEHEEMVELAATKGLELTEKRAESDWAGLRFTKK